VKVLGLFLWHAILVLVFGILGFMGKGAAPLFEQLGVETVGGFFPFLGLICHQMKAGALKWSHQVTCKQYLVPSVHKAGCNWDMG
jgi:hypothetical protein